MALSTLLMPSVIISFYWLECSTAGISTAASKPCFLLKLCEVVTAQAVGGGGCILKCCQPGTT